MWSLCGRTAFRTFAQISSFILAFTAHEATLAQKSGATGTSQFRDLHEDVTNNNKNQDTRNAERAVARERLEGHIGGLRDSETPLQLPPPTRTQVGNLLENLEAENSPANTQPPRCVVTERHEGDVVEPASVLNLKLEMRSVLAFIKHNSVSRSEELAIDQRVQRATESPEIFNLMKRRITQFKQQAKDLVHNQKRVAVQSEEGAYDRIPANSPDGRQALQALLWQNTHIAQLQENHTSITQTVNEILARYGAFNEQNIGQLERAAEILLLHQPELRHNEQLIIQLDAVWRAHLVAINSIGSDGNPTQVHRDSEGHLTSNFTPVQIAQKARILQDSGITKETRRQLMEAGLVGTVAPSKTEFIDQLVEILSSQDKASSPRPTPELASTTRALLNEMRQLRREDPFAYQWIRAELLSRRGVGDEIFKYLYSKLGRVPMGNYRGYEGDTFELVFGKRLKDFAQEQGYGPVEIGGWAFVDFRTFEEMQNSGPLHKLHISADTLENSIYLTRYAGTLLTKPRYSELGGFQIKTLDRQGFNTQGYRPDFVSIYHKDKQVLEELAKEVRKAADRQGFEAREYLLSEDEIATDVVEHSRTGGSKSRYDLLTHTARDMHLLQMKRIEDFDGNIEAYIEALRTAVKSIRENRPAYIESYRGIAEEARRRQQNEQMKRLKQAIDILNETQPDLTETQLLSQLKEVERAHQIGIGEIGNDDSPAGVYRDSEGHLTSNFTPVQIAQKARILKQANIPPQARRALMERGIVGETALASFTETDGLLDQLTTLIDTEDMEAQLGDETEVMNFLEKLEVALRQERDILENQIDSPTDTLINLPLHSRVQDLLSQSKFSKRKESLERLMRRDLDQSLNDFQTKLERSSQRIEVVEEGREYWKSPMGERVLITDRAVSPEAWRIIQNPKLQRAADGTTFLDDAQRAALHVVGLGNNAIKFNREQVPKEVRNDLRTLIEFIATIDTSKLSSHHRTRQGFAKYLLKEIDHNNLEFQVLSLHPNQAFYLTEQPVAGLPTHISDAITEGQNQIGHIKFGARTKEGGSSGWRVAFDIDFTDDGQLRLPHLRLMHYKDNSNNRRQIR